MKKNKKFNESIDKLKDEIKNLKSWNDYTIFNDKKYGMFKFYEKELHTNKNCLGRIKFLNIEQRLWDKLRYYVTGTIYVIHVRKCTLCEEVFKSRGPITKFNFDILKGSK